MPLSIPLPAGAKIIINGAVVENSGGSNTTLTVHNIANILRDKDVLTQTEADTPAKEIYHSVQNAYLFEGNREEWLNVAAALMAQFGRAQPGAAAILADVRRLIGEDKLFNALKASRRLIAFEAGAPDETVAHPGNAYLEPRAAPRQRGKELGRIKDKIATLEKRITALDQSG